MDVEKLKSIIDRNEQATAEFKNPLPERQPYRKKRQAYIMKYYLKNLSLQNCKP
jgi:hypothetical protein